MVKHPKLILFFTLACIVAGVFHFMLTIAYNLADAPVPDRVRNWSNRYTVPLFYQNWQLFAPDLPEYNVELEYRFAQYGAWSQWADASAAHGYGRKSKLETVEQNICSGLAWQVANNFYAKDQRAQFDRIIESGNYMQALFFVKQMHKLHQHHEQPDSLQLRLAFRFTPKPEGAHTYQYSNLELPVWVEP